MSDDRLIAKAWEGYLDMVVPNGASNVQKNETRQAFFAGASVLFHALMGALEEGDDMTQADLGLMTNLQTEIDEFGAMLDVRYLGEKH